MQENATIITKALGSLSYKEKQDIYCQKCGKAKFMDIKILGKIRRMSVMCDCEAKEYEAQKEREEQEQIQRRLNKFKSYSLMDKNFETSTFENWQFKGDNKKIYEFGLKYCENWGEMKKNNRGLIIQGTAGNGKTFLSFAIANELYKQGVAVMAISVSRILRLLQDSYRNNDNIGEMEILNTLSNVSLLILDDLGTESRTRWAYEKLYTIIDNRYRAKKPLIITTNLSNEQLRENLKIVDFKAGIIDSEERIYNRLVEVCATIKIKGTSWRILKGEENEKAMYKELGFII